MRDDVVSLLNQRCFARLERHKIASFQRWTINVQQTSLPQRRFNVAKKPWFYLHVKLRVNVGSTFGMTLFQRRNDVVLPSEYAEFCTRSGIFHYVCAFTQKNVSKTKKISTPRTKFRLVQSRPKSDVVGIRQFCCFHPPPSFTRRFNIFYPVMSRANPIFYSIRDRIVVTGTEKNIIVFVS